MSIVLLNYHCEQSGYGIRARCCTSSRIALMGKLYDTPMLNWRIWQLLLSWNGCIGGRCVSWSFTMPAVWHIRPVANVWTRRRSPLTLDSASSMTNRHFRRVRMHPAVDWKWLFGLVPIPKSTVLFLRGFCILHHGYTGERTIWTDCLSHWSDITRTHPVSDHMYGTSLMQLICWLW